MEQTNLNEICDARIFDKGYMIRLSLNKVLKKRIIEETQWMDDRTPLKVRALALHHRFSADTFPKCRVCLTNPVTYEKSYANTFLDVCGPECGRKECRLSKLAYNRLGDYDWLYDQRFIHRKSVEDIALELGCSTHPVRVAIKKLNIPKIRHNESIPPVLAKLMDRNWLFEEHVVKKRKVRDIANEIGSSAATISRWLVNHDIERNNPNSYNRQFNKVSDEENEVLDFIKSIVPDTEILCSNREILGGKELDIYLPELQIAFEYNGNFSHVFRPEETTPSKIKGPDYHLSKTEQCQSQGIRLVHIFSDDWKYRREIWESIIRSVLNKLDQVRYARKLHIREVSKPEKNQFLRDNHLQGNDRSHVAYGLYDGSQLIAVMSMSRSRYNRNYTWELSRYSVKKNIHCVGGFSRLLSHFRKHHKGSIISYADYSRSNGNVYRQNGFKLLRKNPPSYAYIDFRKSEQRLHRANFTKYKIDCPVNMTEQEYMQLLGYRKIYDCGTLAFVLEES